MKHSMIRPEKNNPPMSLSWFTNNPRMVRPHHGWCKPINPLVPLPVTSTLMVINSNKHRTHFSDLWQPIPTIFTISLISCHHLPHSRSATSITTTNSSRHRRRHHHQAQQHRQWQTRSAICQLISHLLLRMTISCLLRIVSYKTTISWFPSTGIFPRLRRRLQHRGAVGAARARTI